MRQLVATYYQTNDVARGSGMMTERHAEFTFRELEQLVYSPSALKERQKPNMP
jgi:hypothetical protein